MSNMTAVDRWFSSRRLGLLLHFGLYSIEGWHEQDQMRRRIPRADYEKLAARFNPTSFDPDAMLDMAEAAGMEYVCLTTKHHDGFCLWDTKQTDYNVMRTPYGQDIVRKLADACHRRGFHLGLYYSVVDWHHPNYPNQGRHHELAGLQPGDTPDWDRYMAYLREQVRELCTNYGEISHFFWDMNVPEFRDPSINEMLRSLQPNMVICDRGFDAGDFGTPEREYQKGDTDRVSCFGRPTEACNSVGTQSWGYRKEEDYYTSQYLMQSIDAMMSKGAHFLLNVGPDASGQIPAVASDVIAHVGRWYIKVREAFSDTIPCSKMTTNLDVFLTRRGNVVYVHLKHPIKAESVVLHPLTQMPAKAVLLNTGTELTCSTDVIPVFWQDNARILRIKGLPKSAIASAETLVIKVDFGQPLRDGGTARAEFHG